MNTEHHHLVNIYKDDCTVCEENTLILNEVASLDERIAIHEINLNMDREEFKSWLAENSITDAPTIVAIKNSKMLAKIHGSVTVQEILDIFVEEVNS